MCLIKVKEEDDYSVPPRLVRRERRPSPPNARRHSRIVYAAPKPPPIERTYIIQPPPPPPPAPEPEPVSRKPSPPPPAPAPTPAPAPAPAPAPEPEPEPEPKPTTQPHYVEVTPGSESSDSSASEDTRSRTASRSRRTDARSEYHLREREYRRARGQLDPREEYEHYRYVRAPSERGPHGRDEGRNFGGRASFIEDPRASRISQRRERERVVVVGNDGRATREYRR